MTHPAVLRVVEAARAVGVEPDVREFPEGTRTAEDAARAVGCRVEQIVKSLVFVADGGPVVALVSGGHRLEEKKLAAAMGAAWVRRATPDEVRSATGFAIGGTPPLGHARRLPVVMDETLLGFEEVWCAAGTPHTVFSISPNVLLRAADARAANLAEPSDGSPGGV